jgi:FixJ family two-component response regulator
MIEPTVHVVYDDPSFLLALSRLLAANGFRVQTYSSAMAFLGRGRAGEPGCVIADLLMPGMDGLDLQSALARTPNALPIVFLTGEAETALVVRAMRGGAEDFLDKTAKLEVLFDAVHRALARDEQAREKRSQGQALKMRFKALSSREREVLGHVLQGRLNKQIAGDLGIHERTVKAHRRSIMVKLKIRSVAGLARLSHEAGVFTAEPPSSRAIPDERQAC